MMINGISGYPRPEPRLEPRLQTRRQRSGKQTFLCIGATMDKTGGMEAVIRKRVDLARSAFSPRKMCMEDSGSQHNIAVCTMTI